MSEEKNGMSPENNVPPAAENTPERPKRGRPRKVDADGNPVSDPTNVACSFYVRADYIESIADAAEKVLNKEIVEE